MRRLSSTVAGTAAVCAAAVLWAVGGTFARSLIDRGASVVELTEARAWVATAGLGALMVARRGRRPRAKPALRDHILVGLFGLSLTSANLTYYLALSKLPVAVAIVLQYSAPALVVVWAAAVERRPPGGRVYQALGMVLAGVVLLSELHATVASGAFALSPAGVAAALGAAVAFAAYMIVGERVAAVFGTERALFRGFCVASALWACVQAMSGRPETLLDASFIPGVLFLGVVTTLVPFFIFLWGMGHIEASRAGVVSTLEPLTAAVLAWIWLGQRLSVAQLAGGALVVGGIALVQLRTRPERPTAMTERDSLAR